MEFPVKVTKEAFARLTQRQVDIINRLLEAPEGKQHTIELYTQFDLPDDYVGFKLTYSNGSAVWGGIDAEGNASS